MHSLLLLSLLLFRFFNKAKYFEACSNNKIAFFFPLLHIIACKQQTQKAPRGRTKTKAFNAGKFLTINNC